MKYLFIILIIGISCKKITSKGNNDTDVILAEVGNSKLMRSDLSNVIQPGNDKEDSIRILKGLVNNWVKDKLMIYEAEKTMPKDINLNKMIEEYRSSLLLYNYETRLASELLDTLVTPEQKEKYYKENAAQFVLSEAIGKFIIAKIPAKSKGLDNFSDHWKKGNMGEIENYCKQNAEYSDLDINQWKTIDQLQSFLPKNLIPKTSLAEDRNIRKRDKDFEYFLKIEEYVEENKNPPFEYIEPKIVKVLLNERKRNLLRQRKQQLYDKEVGSSKVKIYVK